MEFFAELHHGGIRIHFSVVVVTVIVTAYDCVGLRRPELVHTRFAHGSIFLEQATGKIDLIVDLLAVTISMFQAVAPGTELVLPLATIHGLSTPQPHISKVAVVDVVPHELVLFGRHLCEVVDAGVRRRMLHHDGFEIDLLEFIADALELLVEEIVLSVEVGVGTINHPPVQKIRKGVTLVGAESALVVHLPSQKNSKNVLPTIISHTICICQ